MKAIRLISLAGLVLTALVSCKPAEKDKEDMTIYTPEENKEIIENAVNEVVGLFSKDDAQKLSDFFKSIREAIDNSDTEALEAWAEEALEKIEQVSEKYETKADVFTVRTLIDMLDLAAFNGHLELKDNKWTCTKADDLQIKMKDSRGNDCQLSLVTSGKKATVKVSDIVDLYEYEDYDFDGDGIISDWERGGYYNENGDYVAGRKRCSNITVVMPEKAVMTVTCGKEKYIDAQLNTSFNANGPFVEGDYVINDKAANAAIATMSLSFDVLGYKFAIDDISAKAGKGNIEFSVTKGKVKMLSAHVWTDMYKFSQDDVEINTVNMSISLIDAVRIEGTLDIKAMREIEIDYENEAAFKKAVEQLNTTIDLSVYTASDAKQATIKFEPFFDGEWWEFKPVIVFEDGTSYAFDEYFDEKSFSEAIEKLESIFELFVFEEEIEVPAR